MFKERLGFNNSFATKTLAFELMFMFLSYYVNVFVQNGLGIHFSVSFIFYIFAFLLSLLVYARAFLKAKIVPFLVVLFFLLGTVIFSTTNSNSTDLIFVSFTQVVNSPALILFFYCLPVFLLVTSEAIDYKKLHKYLVRYALIILALFLMCYFVFRVGTESLSTTYMPFSYNAIISICLCLSYKSDSKFVSIISKIIGFVSCFVVLVAGARGALICLICFFLLILFATKKIKPGKKALVFICLTTVVVLGLIFYDEIIEGIGSLLEKNGVYSRTIERLANSSFIKGTDRTELWGKVIDATTLSPLFGYGLWGDRPIVNGYCHNFFVEVICSFGFIFGGLIISIIVLSIVGYLLSKRKGGNSRYYVFLCAIPYGFIQLMFSDSYLMNVWFFFIFGIVVMNMLPHRKRIFVSNASIMERQLLNE